MIWNYELSEVTKGYSETEEQFCCVMCSQKYEKGKIYSENQSLYDAEGAVRQHIRNTHGNRSILFAAAGERIDRVKRYSESAAYLSAEWKNR